MQIGFTGVKGVYKGFYAFELSLAIHDAPSKPSAAWTIDLPPAIASCKRLVVDGTPSGLGEIAGGYHQGAAWFLNLADEAGTAANGCPGAGDPVQNLEYQAVITVVVTAGSESCTATFSVGELVLDSSVRSSTCGGAAPAGETTTGSNQATAPAQPKPTTSPKAATQPEKAATQPESVLPDLFANLASEAKARAAINRRTIAFDHDLERSLARKRAAFEQSLRRELKQAEQQAASAVASLRARERAKAEAKAIDLAVAKAKEAKARQELKSTKLGVRKLSNALGALAAVCSISAEIPEPGEPALATLAGVSRLTARTLAAAAADPPDPDFGTVAKPLRPALPSVRSGQGVPAALLGATNAFVRHQATTIGVLDALRHSLERAQGAARADDLLAEARQLQAAAGLASRVAGAIAPLPGDLLRLRKALAAAGPSASPSTARLRAAQRRIVTGGLPAGVVSALTKAGADQAQVHALRDAVARSTVDSTSLADLLGHPKLPPVTKQTSATLRQLAASLDRLATATKTVATAKARLP